MLRVAGPLRVLTSQDCIARHRPHSPRRRLVQNSAGYGKMSWPEETSPGSPSAGIAFKRTPVGCGSSPLTSSIPSARSATLACVLCTSRKKSARLSLPATSASRAYPAHVSVSCRALCVKHPHKVVVLVLELPNLLATIHSVLLTIGCNVLLSWNEITPPGLNFGLWLLARGERGVTSLYDRRRPQLFGHQYRVRS